MFFFFFCYYFSFVLFTYFLFVFSFIPYFLFAVTKKIFLRNFLIKILNLQYSLHLLFFTKAHIAPSTRQHNAEANQEQVDEPTRAVQVVHA